MIAKRLGNKVKVRAITASTESCERVEGGEREREKER
jgi:hypothetical protein